MMPDIFYDRCFEAQKVIGNSCNDEKNCRGRLQNVEFMITTNECLECPYFDQNRRLRNE